MDPRAHVVGGFWLISEGAEVGPSMRDEAVVEMRKMRADAKPVAVRWATPAGDFYLSNGELAVGLASSGLAQPVTVTVEDADGSKTVLGGWCASKEVAGAYAGCHVGGGVGAYRAGEEPWLAQP